jgi:hypothetical protein
MAKPKLLMKFLVEGGTKRSMLIGKSGTTIPADITVAATAIEAIFLDEGDGAVLREYTKYDVTTHNSDAPSNPPLKSEALQLTLSDEDGTSHTYKLPRPAADNLGTDSKGNEILLATPGATLATHFSTITGYTMTFVEGIIIQDKQS